MGSADDYMPIFGTIDNCNKVLLLVIRLYITAYIIMIILVACKVYQEIKFDGGLRLSRGIQHLLSKYQPQRTQSKDSRVKSDNKRLLDELKSACAMKEFQAELKAMFLKEEGDKIKRVLRKELLEELTVIKREQIAKFRMEMRSKFEDRCRTLELEDMLKAREEKKAKIREVMYGEKAMELMDSMEWVDLEDIEASQK